MRVVRIYTFRENVINIIDSLRKSGYECKYSEDEVFPIYGECIKDGKKVIVEWDGTSLADPEFYD